MSLSPNRVDEMALRYLTMWNEQYGLVNDDNIVAYAVREVMHDLESWIVGEDPNGAIETAGCGDYSNAELLELYNALASTACFFHYTPVTKYLDPDT